MAFAVPKRKIASAVGRNRIKRKLREIYRLHKEVLPKEAPQDFVLLFLGAADADYQKLEKAWKIFIMYIPIRSLFLSLLFLLLLSAL